MAQSPKPTKTSSGRYQLLAAAAVVIAAAGALALFQPWRERPQAVDLIRISEAPASRVLAVNGRIRPQNAVTIRTRYAGQLRSLTKEEGQTIEAGELLAAIDDAPQRDTVAQTAAAVAAQRQ
jgi:multidrug efflux pump subunit AcrA (membrane-fusion protein)